MTLYIFHFWLKKNQQNSPNFYKFIIILDLMNKKFILLKNNKIATAWSLYMMLDRCQLHGVWIKNHNKKASFASAKLLSATNVVNYNIDHHVQMKWIKIANYIWVALNIN
jgi:hypothetical protein